MNKKQAATKAKKPQIKVQDLQPKKEPKGGTRSEALTLNHNESFVCAPR
jgi:hypothetical protein